MLHAPLVIAKRSGRSPRDHDKDEIAQAWRVNVWVRIVGSKFGAGCMTAGGTNAAGLDMSGAREESLH
jgi:hypothetical protein